MFSPLPTLQLYKSLCRLDGSPVSSDAAAEMLVKHACFQANASLVPVIGVCLDLDVNGRSFAAVVSEIPTGVVGDLLQPDVPCPLPALSQVALDLFRGLSHLEL